MSSKIARYWIIMQKSIVFPYRRNKQFKNEINETIPFIIASKGRKYLVNLRKEVQDLY